MGHRLTRPRRAVVEALSRADHPLTARELHHALSGVDLVTVYRTLDWLVTAGVARKVTALPGGGHYEMVTAGAHTHHLHCDLCGRVTTAAICGLDESVYARIRSEFGFAVTDHALTFRGRCADCRRNAA
jgi:Fe2+ or Zn2+ uptake regulation protein